MTNLKLDLDYNQSKPKPVLCEQCRSTYVEGIIKSPADLTENYIGAAVMSTHAQGLDGKDRPVYGRIQRKLDAATEAGETELELEEAEKDFLRKAFEKCKIPAHLSKYFMVLEDEIERVTSRK